MTGILVNDFLIVLMIFLRVVAAFIASPIFGHSAIPNTLKVVLAFVVSYLLFFTIDKTNLIISPDMYTITIYALREIVTGLIIGFMLNIIFNGLEYAGNLIGFDLGLSMAEVFNPNEDTTTNIIGEFLSFTAILIFFMINGHHYFIKALSYSFHIVPVGKYHITKSLFSLIIEYSGSLFIIAVKVASPILVSFFLINIAEGIISRVIPQMQIFFVTQPLKLAVGLLLLSSLIPVYVYVIKNLLEGYEDSLYNLVKAMG